MTILWLRKSLLNAQLLLSLFFLGGGGGYKKKNLYLFKNA